MQHEEEIVFGCLRIIIFTIVVIIAGSYLAYKYSTTTNIETHKIHENN